MILYHGSKDITRGHSRLASILSRYNNAYTLKRADYKLEKVKIQTVGFSENWSRVLLRNLGTGRTWRSYLMPILKRESSCTAAWCPLQKIQQKSFF